MYINNIDKHKVDAFDIIIIDNELNCYGKNNKYCEHFDFIDNIDKFFKDEVFVILNVVKSPFNYDKFSEWKRRRNEFYHTTTTDDLSLEFLMNFYKNKFLENNYRTKKLYIEPREIIHNKAYLYYFAFHLEKIK